MTKKAKTPPQSWEGYELKKKNVFDFVVSEAGMRQAIRRMSMIKELQGMLERDEIDAEIAPALSIYPHIAGCVTPLISIEQFMQLPETVLDELSKAAIELNPHWWPSEVQEKKTEDTPVNFTED